MYPSNLDVTAPATGKRGANASTTGGPVGARLPVLAFLVPGWARGVPGGARGAAAHRPMVPM